MPPYPVYHKAKNAAINKAKKQIRFHIGNGSDYCNTYKCTLNTVAQHLANEKTTLLRCECALVQCDSVKLSELFNAIATSPGLRHISCRGNKLTQLPDLPATLQELYCGYNKLTELPNLPATLQELGCIFNELTELPDLPAMLKMLDCRNNKLTKLPDLPATLQTLWCCSNKLTKLPDLPATLRSLWCDDNPQLDITYPLLNQMRTLQEQIAYVNEINKRV